MGVQNFTTPAGEEMVIMPLAEFEKLLAAVGDPEAEDAATARIVRETSAQIERGDDVALPDIIWEEIEAGKHPVGVVRRFRGLTQAMLAEASGVSQGYISELEKGLKTPSIATLAKLADALRTRWTVLATNQVVASDGSKGDD